MFNNPELQKNIWLNLSHHRLLATPMFIFFVVLVVVLSIGTDNMQDLGSNLSSIFYFSVLLIATIGGCNATVQSMKSEIIEKTWDQQRISPLHPWSLTWGKVLGSSVYVWYVSLILLAALLVTQFIYTSEYSWLTRLEMVYCLLAFALIAQAIGILLITSMVNMSEALIKSQRSHTLAIVLFVFFVGMQIYSAILMAMHDSNSVEWWGVQFKTLVFACLSLTYFAFWTVYGAYRLMRQQMLYKNGQLSWIIFVISLMIFFAGFSLDVGPRYRITMPYNKLVIAFIVGFVLAYALIFMQHNGQLGSLRLVKAIQAREYKKVWQELPINFITILLVCIVLFIITIVDMTGGQSDLSLPAFLFSMLLFLIRDTGIFFAVLIAGNSQRSVALGFLYMFTLYFLFPILLDLLNMDNLAFIFRYAPGKGYAFIAPLVQCVIVFFFVRSACRKHLL